ncbi:MAG: hypothetical protein BBJ57_07480 [Desulfobacterales bacterium PC51MH44]|nr:MAG: hypothetical protein BBJ57_07480 [Desulfobacterales bacterium PC51MH44]
MPKSAIKIQGFARVQIEESGKVVGDSGFVGPNTITNVGFLNYLCHVLGGSAGSSLVAFIALGTGTTAATDAVALPGEIMASTQRKAPTYANVGSTTAQFAATFASSDNFITAAANISNIGLFRSSAENSLFAGMTYASSALNTNQNVNVTYQIRFA